MSLLLSACRATGIVLTATLALAVGLQLATGRIKVRGLVLDKSAASPPAVSPARVQLLISTAAMAFLYVYRVATGPRTGALPDIPGAALGFIGASHLTYAASKALTVFSRSRHLR
jgi:hypothetical protein